MTTITVRSDDLARALGAVIHAAGKDQARPILASVHLHLTGGGAGTPTLRLVAADNYRIAWDEIGGDALTIEGELSPMTVARDDAATLLADLKKLRVSAEVTMTVTAAQPNVLTVAYDGTSRTLRLIDGTYPTYEAVVDAALGRESDTVIGLTGAYLAEVAKVFAPDKPGRGYGRDNGATLSVSFDPSDPNHPLVIRPLVGSAVEVLMPVALVSDVPKDTMA